MARRSARPRLPRVTHPYHLLVRRTQRRWGLSFLIFLLFMSGSLWSWAQKVSRQEDLIDVVVVRESLEAPLGLESSQIHQEKRPRKWVPEDALLGLDSVIGQTLLTHKSSGQILTALDLGPPINLESISAQFQDHVAFGMDESWFVSRLPEIRSGDGIDILTTHPKSWNGASTIITQNVRVIDVQTSGAHKTLLVNVTHEEAKALMSARGLRLPMGVLVRASQKKQYSLTEKGEKY